MLEKLNKAGKNIKIVSKKSEHKGLTKSDKVIALTPIKPILKANSKSQKKAIFENKIIRDKVSKIVKNAESKLPDQLKSLKL